MSLFFKNIIQTIIYLNHVVNREKSCRKCSTHTKHQSNMQNNGKKVHATAI